MKLINRSSNYTTEYAYFLKRIFKIHKLELVTYKPGYSWEVSFYNYTYPAIVLGLFGRFLMLRFK